MFFALVARETANLIFVQLYAEVYRLLVSEVHRLLVTADNKTPNTMLLSFKKLGLNQHFSDSGILNTFIIAAK